MGNRPDTKEVEDELVRAVSSLAEKILSERAPPLTWLLTAKQVAAQTGVSDQTVYRAAESGRLAVVRIGRRLLFQESDVVAWIEQHTVRRSPAGAMSDPRPRRRFKACH